MVCFCKQSAAGVHLAIRTMVAETSNQPAQRTQSAAAQRVSSVANWLAARGLPQPPWQADPAWLDLVLPTPKLNPSALATLNAMAQLHAQTKALFNIDLLAAGSATALVRLVATLNARLSAMAADPVSLSIDASTWLTLASEAEAASAVTQAAQQTLFTPSQALTDAYLAPGGIQLSHWTPFLDAIAALSPLIAIKQQLGVTDPATLAATLRTLNAIEVPALTQAPEALALITALSAVARLRVTLGVNVLETGLSQASDMVAERVQEAEALIPKGANPPRAATCPTLVAPPAVVAAAASPEVAALASLDWKVPALPSLPALATLLPALSLSASIAAALQTPAVMMKPCAAGCDSASLMRSL